MEESDEILFKLQQIIEMYEKGQLGGEVMPEDVLRDVVPKSEMVTVLTLPMSLNYQRNSYKLWESVVFTYNDSETRWVFDLESVINSDLDNLRKALLKYKVALQPNKHPEIWQRVANGFRSFIGVENIPQFLAYFNYDISLLKDIMQNKLKKEFPYLSGPKIFNYWLYALESYANISWESRKLITIAPDTHVLQATVKLGICTNEVLKGTKESRTIVSDAWEKVLENSSMEPIDVHTPLWLWSRKGFPKVIDNT